MIKPLRKRHLQIWIALTFLLPGGMLLGWLVIPSQEPVKLIQTSSGEPLPMIVKTGENENYRVYLRSNKDKTAWQLEWQNKTVLTVPSAVIYSGSTTGDISGMKLVGRIETKGRYFFTIEPSIAQHDNLLLYDFIHDKIIDSINIKP